MPPGADRVFCSWLSARACRPFPLTAVAVLVSAMTLSPVLSRPPFRVSGVPSPAPDVARHVPYVYDIVRRPFPLEAGVPELLFVLLNPSSAGGPGVPATLRRCDRIALSLGHASYRVAHLFAYPARQPRLLVAAAVAGVDIVGPRNDEHLAAAVRGARRVVVAWGSFRGAAVRALVVPRAQVVAERLSALTMCPLECLAVAPDGAPCHPLFVRADATLAVWRARGSAARRDGLPPPLREPAFRVLPLAPVVADVPQRERVASGPPALGRLAAYRARAAATAAVAPAPAARPDAARSPVRPPAASVRRARRHLPGLAEERAVILPLL